MNVLVRLSSAAVLAIFATALCLYSVVASIPQDATEPAGHRDDDNGSLRLPAVIAFGDKGAMLRDVHETLNQELGGGPAITISPDVAQVRILDDVPQATDDCGEHGSQLLILKDGRELRVPRCWAVSPSLDDGGSLVPNSITLPANAIESFGVFGDQTFALVLFFQIREGLRPTGEVDAVTLHHLEPIVPASSPMLHAVMQWTIGEDHSRAKRGSDDPESVKPTTIAITLGLILLAVLVAYLVTWYLAGRWVTYVGRHATNDSGSPKLLAAMCRQPFCRNGLSHLGPALIVYVSHLVFPGYWVHELDLDTVMSHPGTFYFWNRFLAHIGLAYLIGTLTIVALGFIRACGVVWGAPIGTTANEEATETTALRGILSFARGAVWTSGIVLFLAALTGRNPLVIVGSVGIFMAVFSVIFRDALLGLAASVEIVAHDIVRVGDWIEMPKYAASGEVCAITLVMIKVQNFDKTISTIPTHAVLSDAFRNYRNKHEPAGRRIRRSIHLDIDSITACTPETTARYVQIVDNLAAQQGGLTVAERGIEHSTNLGWFREFVTDRLRLANNFIYDEREWIVLVRHLQPTSKGLPVEIFAYCTQTDWGAFELAQAEVFEDLLSILPGFHLRVFQDTREFPQSLTVSTRSSRRDS